MKYGNPFSMNFGTFYRSGLVVFVLGVYLRWKGKGLTKGEKKPPPLPPKSVENLVLVPLTHF